MEDDVIRIFLSTRGENEDEVNPVLIHFLKYISDSTKRTAEKVQDRFVDELHQRIMQLKSDRQLEENYMKFEEMLADQEKKGQKQGQDSMLQLIMKMTAEGLQNEIPRLEFDLEFRREMMKRYQLENVL